MPNISDCSLDETFPNSCSADRSDLSLSLPFSCSASVFTHLFLLDILPYAIIHSAAVMPATPTMALGLWANLLKAGAIFRFVSFSPV